MNPLRWIIRITKVLYTQVVRYRYIFFIRCEISTPQFLGCQENYYMFNQTGWYCILNREFHTDWKVKGSHNVSGWQSFNDFKNSVVRYL